MSVGPDGARIKSRDAREVGTVVVVENLRPDFTESEMRSLLRKLWMPITGKHMYDAGAGQARGSCINPYVKMSCAG